MRVYVQGPPSPVIIVTDWRQRADAELDVSRPASAPHVLCHWKLGVAALGIQRYSRCRRVALFDYDAKPSGQAVAQARDAWLRLLQKSEHGLRILVLPTPDVSLGEGRSSLAGSVCWSALKPPDTLEAMRLTAWDCADHTVTPLFPIARRIKPLQVWAMVEAMRRATHDYVKNPRPGVVYTQMGGAMRSVLNYFAKTPGPLAVDLEFLPQRDIVTAIGISDGELSVSVPWHDYTPTGSIDVERGVAAMPDLARLVADALKREGAKYFHNYVADVPRLEKLGLHVTGPLCDTFAAHAIAFPELRHGLQAATASLLYVPPWKSVYRPQGAHGFTKDDEEFWTASPDFHREYNAKDAFYCWHLAQQVLPCVGINPQTGIADGST